MQVTLSTGRTVEIAPLTIHQCRRLLEVNEALPPVRTWKDDVAIMVARLKVCHESIQRAGGKETLEDLEEKLLVPEVDELFNLVVNLTLQESRRAVAWARCDNQDIAN